MTITKVLTIYPPSPHSWGRAPVLQEWDPKFELLSPTKSMYIKFIWEEQNNYEVYFLTLFYS
jgi:hypothetical protein